MKRNLVLSALILGLCVVATFFFRHASGQDSPRNNEHEAVAAQANANLFSFARSGKGKTRERASIASVREQVIDVNFDAVTSGTQQIDIALLDGQTRRAVRLDAEGYVARAADDYTWKGKISDETGWSGDVILTFKGGALSGLIYAPHATYEIVPQPTSRTS